MITVKAKGNFSNTYKFLEKCKNAFGKGDFNRYGRMGVDALRSATPIESGKTAESWTYDVIFERHAVKIVWSNTNIVDNCPIAIILQYGHATKDGRFISGRDYINPAIQPVFDEIAEDAWKEVTSL